MNEKELIARRAAALLQPGWIVNLGIGIPWRRRSHPSLGDELHCPSRNSAWRASVRWRLRRINP